MKIRSILSAIIGTSLILGAAQASAAALIVQERAPCGDNSIEEILTGWGISYDVSATVPAMQNLNAYDTVIVASHQRGTFYSLLGEAMPRLTRWLKAGNRTLEFHGATGCAESSYDLTLPRGVVPVGPTWANDANTVKARRSPLTAGLPHTFGPYNSIWTTDHTFPAVGRVDTVDSNGLPTTIDYCVGGTGRVIATGLPVERFYSDQLDSAVLLTNMLAASVYTPGCQNQPPQ